MQSSRKYLKVACAAWSKKSALFLVAAYRSVGPALLGGSCRFEPSCSHYAAEAFERHEAVSAARLVLSRLLKCRPGGPSGFDPVPEIGINP